MPHRFRWFSVSLACAAALPAAAGAQATAGPRLAIGAGLSFQNDDDVTARGLHVQGSLILPLGERFEARLETSIQHFGGSNSGPICAPADVCFSGGGEMTVVWAVANLAFTEQRDRRGSFYWTGGVGLYGVTASPRVGPYARYGWNAGGGLRFGAVFVEVRYHGLLGGTRLRHLVPITAGVRL